MTTNTIDNADQVEAQLAKDPKRFASSGTRRGNGSGWGGPAKGAGKPAAKAQAFQPGNKVAVRDKASEV